MNPPDKPDMNENLLDEGEIEEPELPQEPPPLQQFICENCRALKHQLLYYQMHPHEFVIGMSCELCGKFSEIKYTASQVPSIVKQTESNRSYLG